MEQEHQPDRRTDDVGEHSPGLAPQIYVASLSDYNAGRLHGTWLNAATDPDDLLSGVARMLEASPEPGAEEYAIHDYEEFGCIHLHEYTDLATVSRLAQGLVQHGCAFGHWANYIGTDPDDLDRFEEAYRGHWPSLEDYAADLLDDLGVQREIEEAVPDWVRHYVTIDLRTLGQDLAMDGYVVEDGDGVWVYNG